MRVAVAGWMTCEFKARHLHTSLRISASDRSSTPLIKNENILAIIMTNNDKPFHSLIADEMSLSGRSNIYLWSITYTTVTAHYAVSVILISSVSLSGGKILNVV